MVELIWDDNINNCENMFKECSKITEIYISNFDTSQIIKIGYMFCNCSSLTSIDLSNFNASQVTDMNHMFSGCSSLTSLDISNFNTSQVIDMYNMFSGCSALTSLDLSNFNTSQVISMTYMLSICSSLTSLDLSNFNTSLVTNIFGMFNGCKLLISLDLSNFDNSKVTSMHNMFSGCSLLTSLDLSNFNNSQVKNMNNMFSGCSLMTSLDLSNFDTSQVTHISYMFYDCVNLEYINLNCLDKNNLSYIDNVFDNEPENFVIYINENITKQKLLWQIKNKTCHVLNCTDDWKLKQKKLINNNDSKCIENFDNISQYPYEYNGKCYENCSKGFLYDENNNQLNKCKCELDKCLLCPKVVLYKNLCTECNINYCPKENDPSNIGEYIDCYKDLEGYYLDNNLYKQCFFTFKTCNKSGNNKIYNCIECNGNYSFGIKNDNYSNCYKNCSNYYYFDNENN